MTCMVVLETSKGVMELLLVKGKRADKVLMSSSSLQCLGLTLTTIHNIEPNSSIDLLPDVSRGVY